jgi:MFS family permease
VHSSSTLCRTIVEKPGGEILWTAVVSRLVRDRVTWLHYAQQGMFGYFQFGWGPSVLAFRQELHISHTVVGLYGPALAIGAAVGGALFSRLARRLSAGVVLSASLAGLAFGVAAFCLMSSVPGTLAAAALTMAFGIMVLSGVSTGLTELHGATAGAAISEANAASACMGLVAPVLINLSVTGGAGWRTAMGLSVVVAAALSAVTFMMRGRMAPDVMSSRHADTPCPRSNRGRLPVKYRYGWICLLAIMSVETAMMLWVPEQLRDRTGLTAEVAAIGVSAVLGGMVVGRLAGARMALRIPTAPLMFAALATAAAGFGVFWTASAPEVAFAGLVCCGLGMSLHFPLAVALTMRASDGQLELAVSRNAVGVALAYGVAPFILGALADDLGTSRAFAIIPVCLLIAALAVGRLTRQIRPRTF